jgi:hypothetical protein
MIPFSQQFTLSYIGRAAAICQPINIPLIIRALTRALSHKNTPPVSVTFDRDFLLFLDAGTEDDDPAAVVNSYHNQWWRHGMEPSAEQWLSLETIDACLRHHQTVSTTAKSAPAGLLKTRYTWSRHVQSLPADTTLDCPRCRLYRGVTMGVRDDLQDIQNATKASGTAYGGHFRLAQHRAAGAFQLYEAAALKELQSASRLQVNPMTVKTSPAELVRLRAAGQLVSLKKAPGLKWTAGEALTKTEVLNFVKPHPHSGRLHSGYVKPLPWGSHNDNSPSPSHSQSGECVFSVMDVDQEVPELDSKDYPHHFRFPPLRQYYSDDRIPDTITRPNISTTHYVPTPPPVISVADAAAAATSLTAPINIPAGSRSPALSPSPPPEYDCSLCERPIIFYHKDHRSGMTSRFCLICHKVWLVLNKEREEEQGESGSVEIIDLVDSPPPHQQPLAAAHSSLVYPEIIELTDSDGSRADSAPLLAEVIPAAAQLSTTAAEVTATCPPSLPPSNDADHAFASSPDSDHPSDAFSDLPPTVPAALNSPAVSLTRLVSSSKVPVDSDDPDHAFASSPDSDHPSDAFSDLPPTGPTALPHDNAERMDFSDQLPSAPSPFIGRRSAIPPSNSPLSCSPGSAFSDLPAHSGPSHRMSLDNRSTIPPSNFPLSCSPGSAFSDLPAHSGDRGSLQLSDDDADDEQASKSGQSFSLLTSGSRTH